MHMCMAAYVISRSQNIARARIIYPLLAPYAGQIVVNAGAVTFGGVVDHYLGLLATALDQPETAARHLDHAIADTNGSAPHSFSPAPSSAATNSYFSRRPQLCRASAAPGCAGREANGSAATRV
jgi:hypothetical protein